MQNALRKPSNDLRLVVYVATGTFLGAAYVVFDILSESKIRSGTLTGALADAHAVVDHVFPLLVGALLGVGVHYVRLRAKLAAAEEAASRAEALRLRLHRVERDQAVWVLAAAVLHELNNPLHALGLLLDELDTVDDGGAERSKLIGRARVQADRALSHLATLRSMPHAGEPELQRVALDRFVERVADDLRPLAAEDGLTVRVESDGAIDVTADPTYLRTILENLVDNSLCSLRAKGGAVTIRVMSDGEKSVVRVTDDGPVLDPDVRSVLFEPLRTTKTHGLGLGLPIARALARAMRGDLSFDEENGKEFRLDLPVWGLPERDAGAVDGTAAAVDRPIEPRAPAPLQEGT